MFINFRYNYIRGERFGAKDIMHNGLAELEMITKGKEVKKIKFVIETKEQFEYLKSIFEQWYISGIQIKEEFTSHKFKTICLEMIGDWSYKEVRELKNKLKIK